MVPNCFCTCMNTAALAILCQQCERLIRIISLSLNETRIGLVKKIIKGRLRAIVYIQPVALCTEGCFQRRASSSHEVWEMGMDILTHLNELALNLIC